MEKILQLNEEKYYHNLIEKEQIALKEFFIYYLPKDFRPKTILNFCAGVANEEPVLHDLYGNDISLVSFDKSKQMIDMAKDLELDRKSLINLDISDVKNKFKDSKFDLLIGRNIPINPNRPSNYSDEVYPDAWLDFILNCKNKIFSDGYLLMTLARDDEFERAKELLKESGFNILKQENNHIIVPSDRIGIAGSDVKDNYVILAK